MKNIIIGLAIIASVVFLNTLLVMNSDSSNTEKVEKSLLTLSLKNLQLIQNASAFGESGVTANGPGRRYRCSGFLFFGRRTGLDCMAQNSFTCIPRGCD